jgi:CubicO group peptidase (beta-lactamase class C family)
VHRWLSRVRKKSIALLALLFIFNSCTYYRYLRYNIVGITDYSIFPSRQLISSTQPFCFTDACKNPLILDSVTNQYAHIKSFNDLMLETQTVAYLIIKNDSILYSWYNEKYGASLPVLSFSMAKSITSILVGCAINDGYIKNVNEPVIKYVSELSKNKNIEKLRIADVLNMRSGLDFKENYKNPFSPVVRMYYGCNFIKLLKKVKLKYEPGTRFRYQNGDTELLGLILTRALKNKTITDYCNEKLWIPLQMEYPAMWNINDYDKLEKTFCCIAATAIDYAKIGRLYLNKGNWNGTQLVPAEWVNESWQYVGKTYYGRSYHYQWWAANPQQFYADGHLGQYIFVDTNKKIIIVRLGKTRKNYSWTQHFKEVCERL